MKFLISGETHLLLYLYLNFKEQRGFVKELDARELKFSTRAATCPLLRACSVTCKIEFAVIDHVWQVAKHLGLSSSIQSETKILRTLSSHWLPYDQHTS